MDTKYMPRSAGRRPAQCHAQPPHLDHSACAFHPGCSWSEIMLQSRLQAGVKLLVYSALEDVRQFPEVPKALKEVNVVG
jgi:hypothetical protein